MSSTSTQQRWRPSRQIKVTRLPYAEPWTKDWIGWARRGGRAGRWMPLVEADSEGQCIDLLLEACRRLGERNLDGQVWRRGTDPNHG